jgi:hypothetical protein
VEKTGTLTGHREKGLESFWVVLHDFGSVSLGWLGLPDHYYIFAVAMGVLLILLFFVVFVLRWRRSPHFFSYENLAIAYFIIYAVFILLTATISRFQQLDSRLLSPLFIPFLWGCYSMIASSIHGRMAGRIAGRMTGRMTAMKEERGVAGWVVMGILLAGFVIVQYGQVRTYRENWEGIADAGIPGYTEDDWRHSATMEFIRRNKDSLEEANTLYTNADDAIWFLTGMHAVLLPHKDFTMDVQTLLAKDHFNVAWFNDGINPDLVSVATIGRYKKLARVAAFPDGAVYFFTTK